MIPKGKLIAIGGAEDKGTDKDLFAINKNNPNYTELGILKRIVAEAGGKNAHIEVITTASMIPGEVGRNYLSAFTKAGCSKVNHMRIRKTKEAENDELLERLKVCDAVMFSGGNQSKLTSVFGGTQFLEILKERYTEENFIIAGTSAGAMAMSKIMIADGKSADAHLKGVVKISTGLWFIDGIIIDSHVNKRGRFVRMSKTIALNLSQIGIGLGEDTGVVITNGNELEVIGSGIVLIVDGKNIQHNNVPHIKEGETISIENLKVHILEKRNRYNIAKRKFTET